MLNLMRNSVFAAGVLALAATVTSFALPARAAVPADSRDHASAPPDEAKVLASGVRGSLTTDVSTMPQDDSGDGGDGGDTDDGGDDGSD